MSNELAIAAVTRTLRDMIANDGDITVTTKNLDQAAQDAGDGERINLFLYHAMPNPAWGNMDMPGQVGRGERSNPPLALNLHYLLTAYGEDGSNLADQRLLGLAMRVLNDRAILKKDQILNSTRNDPFLRDSDLHEQIEKVRVVSDPLNIEEMSRLWTTFQTQYRVSAAFLASVVLIESKRPTKSALPVVSRGENDRGVRTDLGLDPVLEGIEYRADPLQPALPAANVGHTITIVGSNMPGTGISVVVRDPKRQGSGAIDDDVVARLTPTVEKAGTRLRAELTEDAGLWSTGVLSLELGFDKDGRSVSSNAVPLSLAPRIQASDVEESVIAFIDDVEDKRLLTISLSHPIGRDRRVVLILNRVNSRQTNGQGSFFQITREPDTQGVGDFNPVFDVSDVPSGTYRIRLRADGVDSLVMLREQNQEGKWIVRIDEKQKVTI